MFHHRSLRQLRKEVKSKLHPKANLPGLKASPANSAASSIYTDVHQLPKSGAIDEEEVTSLTQAVQGKTPQDPSEIYQVAGFCVACLTRT